MPYTKDFPGVAERIGNGTADFADKLADAVRNFACSLWNSFPDQITQNSNLASSFARGVMTAACDPNNPPPPAEPFTGGQCPCILYNVRYRADYTQNGTPFSFTNLNAGDRLGPIIGLSWNLDYDLFTSAVVQITYTECDQGQPIGQLTSPAGFSTGADPGSFSATITSVTRLDGQPDNCGNPPPIYPPTNPTSNDYTTIITINNNDGTTVNFPLTYIPITNNFPLNFDLGGISISLDLGGVNFNFDGRRPNGDPEPLGDGQETPVPTPLDDLDRNFPAPRQPTPNPDDYEEEPRTPTDPKEETIGDDVAFVKVTLTQIPSNAKQQWGDGAPDVIYAGWFEFQAGGHYFPRQPIHFENSIFVPPRGVIGYAYTLYNGFNGFATIYKLKET